MVRTRSSVHIQYIQKIIIIFFKVTKAAEKHNKNKTGLKIKL